VADIQQRLAERFPFLERQDVQEVSLVLGPAGPTAPVSEIATSWSFSTEEGVQAVLAPDSATLSAAGDSYHGIAAFTERFEALLSALAQSPPRQRRCDRLGVRFLNLAAFPTETRTPDVAWFKPEVTGWIHTTLLEPDTQLASTVTQTEIVALPTGSFSGMPGPIQATIRHGMVPSGSAVPGIPPITVSSPSYLLDFDLFITAPQPFDVRVLLGQFRTMHRHIDSFFRWTLTDEGAEHFGLEELEEP